MMTGHDPEKGGSTRSGDRKDRPEGLAICPRDRSSPAGGSGRRARSVVVSGGNDDDLFVRDEVDQTVLLVNPP